MSTHGILSSWSHQLPTAHEGSAGATWHRCRVMDCAAGDSPSSCLGGTEACHSETVSRVCSSSLRGEKVTGNGKCRFRRDFLVQNVQDSAMACSPTLPGAPAEGWTARWLHPDLEFLPQGAGKKLHPQEFRTEAQESMPSPQKPGWEGWELLWEVLWCLNQSVGIP